jgi:hypothetical protein
VPGQRLCLSSFQNLPELAAPVQGLLRGHSWVLFAWTPALVPSVMGPSWMALASASVHAVGLGTESPPGLTHSSCLLCPGLLDAQLSGPSLLFPASPRHVPWL